MFRSIDLAKKVSRRKIFRWPAPESAGAPVRGSGRNLQERERENCECVCVFVLLLNEKIGIKGAIIKFFTKRQNSEVAKKCGSESPKKYTL